MVTTTTTSSTNFILFWKPLRMRLAASVSVAQRSTSYSTAANLMPLKSGGHVAWSSRVSTDLLRSTDPVPPIDHFRVAAARSQSAAPAQSGGDPDARSPPRQRRRGEGKHLGGVLFCRR